jgi:integration host factor subunit beta
MNKSQLIEALAKHENLTLKKAEMVVNAIFENMAEALIRNERIEIRGFGSFKVKYYNGYKGRNPKTLWGRGPGAAGPCPLPHTPSPNPLRGFVVAAAGKALKLFQPPPSPKNPKGGWGGGCGGRTHR